VERSPSLFGSVRGGHWCAPEAEKKGGFAAAAGGWGWREGKGDLVVF